MLQAARFYDQKEGLRLAVADVCPVVDVAGAVARRYRRDGRPRARRRGPRPRRRAA